MTEDERKLLRNLEALCRAYRALPQDAGWERFHVHADAMATAILARPARREMQAASPGPVEWQGWTERGEQWLAAGCPPIKQEPEA